MPKKTNPSTDTAIPSIETGSKSLDITTDPVAPIVAAPVTLEEKSLETAKKAEQAGLDAQDAQTLYNRALDEYSAALISTEQTDLTALLDTVEKFRKQVQTTQDRAAALSALADQAKADWLNDVRQKEIDAIHAEVIDLNKERDAINSWWKALVLQEFAAMQNVINNPYVAKILFPDTLRAYVSGHQIAEYYNKLDQLGRKYAELSNRAANVNYDYKLPMPTFVGPDSVVAEWAGIGNIKVVYTQRVK